MLEIKNLHVSLKDKEILRGLNLKLEKGKIHALMGPNGSGKTTLAYVLMGHPSYSVTSGQVLLDGKDLLALTPDTKAKEGIFLSFQNPVEIEGVKLSTFLRQAYNSLHEKKLSILEFNELLEKEAHGLGIPKEFLSRYLNKGFSGGEKKKAEILQLLVLNPKIAILDETDSGLDIDSLKLVAEGINSFMNKDKIVLIITHYKRILEYVKPDKVSIIINGKIVLEGDGKLVNHLEEKGYEWLKKWKVYKSLEYDYLTMDNIVTYKGKEYDLTKRGPCCDWYAERRREEIAEIKAINRLTGGIPRSIVMWYEIKRSNGRPYLALDGESCPCTESPRPVLFRRLMIDKLNGKSLDEALEALVKEEPSLDEL